MVHLAFNPSALWRSWLWPVSSSGLRARLSLDVCNEVKDAINSGVIGIRQAVIISQIKPNGAPNVPRSWDSQREFLSLLLKDEERKGKKLSDQETLQLTRISGGCWRPGSCWRRRARSPQGDKNLIRIRDPLVPYRYLSVQSKDTATLRKPQTERGRALAVYREARGGLH